MTITVKMRGTCGELAQGFFRGEPILITCPIEKFSTAVVSDEFALVDGLGSKSKKILGNVLKIFGAQDFKFGVRLTSELPRGKGKRRRCRPGKNFRRKSSENFARKSNRRTEFFLRASSQ